jgi:PAS domain S-box-containing protein
LRARLQLTLSTPVTPALPDHERYHLAVEAAPTAIVMIDEHGTITLVNAETEKQFGYDRAQLLGRSIDMLVPERFRGDHPRFRRAFFTAPRTRAMGAGRELFGRRRDGSEFPVEIGLNPLGTEAGTFVLAAIVDITDRKQLQREREELIRKLEEGVRQRDQFLAILGHELRNPLAAIGYATEILKRVGGGTVVEEKQRAVIGRKVHHLSRLVDDLLDVVRLTTGRIVLQREPLDLRDVARIAFEAQREAANAGGIEIALETCDEPVVVTGDPVRLDQILSNLLTNAIKYNKPEGRVDMEIARVGDQAVVTVRDTGIGIPADLLNGLFDMFVQADSSLARSQGGLGIGLTLARRLAEMHGGSLGASSAGVDRGSEFRLRLPLREPQREADAEPPATKGRVLLVEDDDDLRTSLDFLLQDTGYATLAAADGAEGLDLALRERPAVAIVDIGLPKIDGYEVAKRLRAELGSAIRLIAMTGYGTAEDHRRALRQGFDAHLAKPVDLGTLERLLETMLGGS